MPKKLNDTQIAELIMKYTNGTSISALAREYEIGYKTAQRYINNNRELTENCQAIKKEATRTMLEYLVNNQGKAQGLLDLLLDLTETDIKKASLRDRMGAVKIIAETFGVTKGDGDTGGEPISVNITFAKTGEHSE